MKLTPFKAKIIKEKFPFFTTILSVNTKTISFEHINKYLLKIIPRSNIYVDDKGRIENTELVHVITKDGEVHRNFAKMRTISSTDDRANIPVSDGESIAESIDRTGIAGDIMYIIIDRVSSEAVVGSRCINSSNIAMYMLADGSSIKDIISEMINDERLELEFRLSLFGK